MRTTLMLILSLTILFSIGVSAEVITATGFGTVDSGKIVNPAQGKMMARRAAKVDALRQLAEAVKGVKLSSGTTVEEYEVTSDIIATRVKNVIKGAFVVDQTITVEADEFVAEIEMAICFDRTTPKCADKPTLQDIIDTTAK